MKYPFYLKSRLVKYPSFIMILSELECIEVCTDDIKIERHSKGVMCQHFINDKGYEETTASDFQLNYAETRKKFTDKITAPELLRLENIEQLQKAS